MYLASPGLAEHGLQNRGGVDVRASELVKNAAIAKHQHTRTKSDKFFNLAGEIHHRLALRGKLPQMPVQLSLGTNVNAARGVIQHQDVGVQGESPADQHLLLVAAAQRGDFVAAFTHADSQALDFPIKNSHQIRPGNQPKPTPARLAPVQRHEQVLVNAQVGKNAFALAVTGYITNALADGRLQALNSLIRALPVAYLRRAAHGRIDSGHHAHKLALPLPVQTGNPQDFTLTQAAAHRAGAWPDLHRVHLQDRSPQTLGRPRCLCLFIALGFSGHQAQQVFFGDLGFFQNPNIHPIAQHRSAVTDPDQFRNPVGDDDDGATAVAQRAHLGEQTLGGIQIQRCGRLVQDQHPRLAQQGAADGDPLFDIQRQAANRHLRVNRDARELTHQGGSPIIFFLGTQGAGPQAIRADVQVLGHRALIGNQNFLKHSGNTRRTRLVGCGRT